MAEEMEWPGEGQIRALITCAGNPALSAPNGPRLSRALSRLDFMVSVDLYINETTRHAHLILPTSCGLERDHYDLVLYLLSVRNTAKYAAAQLTPPDGVRHDWEVLLDLGLRLRQRGGGRRRLWLELFMRLLRLVGPQRLLDLMLRLGPHRLSLARLKAASHGLDLGPLTPCLSERLATRSKRIELAPPIFGDAIAALPLKRTAQPVALASSPLLLIGRRQLRSNNSWMHNSERLVKGPTACTLLMHPDDAAHRGLVSGESVRITSRVGAVTAPLKVTPDIARGVVSLPHGWGHGQPGVGLNIAKRHAGVSINDLTDDAQLDGISGTAGFSGVPVTVERTPS
jgi:anaerobic selenocysteine-containing dehydrogenase